MAQIKEPIIRCQSFINATLINGFCPYSFLPEQKASTEATAWCLIALASDGSRYIRPAIDFLLNSQNKDGGWSTGPGLGQSDWTSAPATLALRMIMYYHPDIIHGREIQRRLRDAIHYLLGLRVDFLSPVARLLALCIKGVSGLHYSRGWPWDANCYNWVEPTAYSLMAFKLPNLIEEELAMAAIFHANKFLLEHSCREGGWNHGCFYTLGVFYPPYRVTTAEAVLALADESADKRVQAGLEYLKKVDRHNQSAMALAWNILALDSHGKDSTEQLNQLLSLQNEDGSFGTNYLVTGLSLLAMNTANGINPLRPIKGNSEKI